MLVHIMCCEYFIVIIHEIETTHVQSDKWNRLVLPSEFVSDSRFMAVWNTKFPKENVQAKFWQFLRSKLRFKINNLR